MFMDLWSVGEGGCGGGVRWVGGGGGGGGATNTVIRGRVGSPMAFKMLLQTYSKDAAATGHWLRLRNSSTLAAAVVLSSLVVVARLHQVACCIREIDKKKNKKVNKTFNKRRAQKNIKQHKTQRYYLTIIIIPSNCVDALSISFWSP